MIGTEIRELDAVLKHVVDRREQRASYRAGCLLRAAATSEPAKLSVEVATFLAPDGPRKPRLLRGLRPSIHDQADT
jgi:hypothetical protein